MSFFAVLGMLIGTYFTEKMSKYLHNSRLKKTPERILNSLLSSVTLSLFANVFVCLPLSLCFDELSLISVVSTLIISPFISAFLFLAPLLLLTSLVALFSFLTPLLAVVCRGACRITLAIVSFLSAPEGITLSLNFPFIPIVIVSASLILFILLVIPLRRKFWIPLVPTLATVLLFGLLTVHNATYDEQLTVDYLSDGESEMLVLTTTEDAVICDLSTGANQYLYDAILFSRERYQTELSALMLTHYHARHITTFSRNADSHMIRTLYLPFPENADEYYIMYSLIDTAKKKNVNVILFDRGTDFSPAPDITLRLSSPVYLKRSTHPTFTLSVSAFGETVTYIAESAHEDAQLYESISDSNPEYVIFGTHGPITKTPFSYENLGEAHAVFVYDKTVLSYLDPYSIGQSDLIFGSDHITLRLENKKQ